MFLTFGEIMARIAPPERLRWRQAVPGKIEVTWGGGEANVAASLAMFGLPARFVTALPRHAITETLVSTLRGLGVDTDKIYWRKQGRLGLYFVEVGANQRGSTVLYDREYSAISLATPDEYDFSAALAGAKWLHITGITPAISENACRSNLALVQQAKKAGVTVSCDLNFRKKLWNWRPGTASKQLARECMTALLPFIDLVIANEEDAADVLNIHASGTDVTQGHVDAAAYEQVAPRDCASVPQRFTRGDHLARKSISGSQQLGCHVVGRVFQQSLFRTRQWKRSVRTVRDPRHCRSRGGRRFVCGRLNFWLELSRTWDARKGTSICRRSKLLKAFRARGF